jgi:hypothetical protein
MRVDMKKALLVSLTFALGCAGAEGGADVDADLELAHASDAVTCSPRMTHFPVGEAHNIGYDHRTCSTGRCAVSCPDQNANSDWGGRHHGIDIFARRNAPLVAVAPSRVVAVGVVSSTSGLRVRLRDDCGWEYYYGHLESAAVRVGQRVQPGQLIGRMGNSGTGGVHLHFNVSPDGRYSSDINPFNLLVQTSPTACAAPPSPPPPPPAPTNCGRLAANQGLRPYQNVTSCNGRYNLVHQGDGNVVLYRGGSALWHTHTHGRNTSNFVMQGDGNLVLYASDNRPLWHTHTHGTHGATLSVQDDGNVVIYRNGRALWSTGTAGR